jgi:outer membrane receptor protein involved in Fe transport
VEFTRYRQRTNEYLISGSFVSQVTPEHLVKAGGEIHWPTVQFGDMGRLEYAGRPALARFSYDPPEYKPVMAAAYAQDQMEWQDLTVRAGLRLEYFDARSEMPGDPANPANAIPGIPYAEPKPTSKKICLAPRLGVAYPISDAAGIHFAYGHSYQFPAIGEIFQNADYSILDELQSGITDYGVMGNPDVKPEKTVQYEIGYKHALTPDLGVDLNVFYKDIRNLLGVEFISTYNAAEYTRLTNVDFGDVVGFTAAVDHRRLGPVGLSFDYTWQLAQGNSSDPRETATRAEAHKDPRPRLVPLNWDQRHTVNMTARISSPRGTAASLVLRLASGQPYTPALGAIFGTGLEQNSGRKPTSLSLDLRAEQGLALGDFNLGLFGRVFNVLDTRFFNGRVFDSTGSPYYSRFVNADRYPLADPSGLYAPRRIEIGVKVEPRS